MSIEKRIANLLYEHYDFSHLTSRCECGVENSGGEDSDRDHVDHVASVLVRELRLNEIFASVEHMETTAATLNPQYDAVHHALAKKHQGGAQ